MGGALELTCSELETSQGSIVRTPTQKKKKKKWAIEATYVPEKKQRPYKFEVGTEGLRA